MNGVMKLSRDPLLRRSVCAAGQPARPQVSRCVGLSASDRKYPALTGRSGTQRARCLRSRMTAGSAAPWSSSPSPVLLTASWPRPALPRPLPRTRLLPDLVTDGFSQARLGVYMSPAPLTEAVALRSQTGLTGSGRHRYSYGGFGGGHTFSSASGHSDTPGKTAMMTPLVAKAGRRSEQCLNTR